MQYLNSKAGTYILKSKYISDCKFKIVWTMNDYHPFYLSMNFFKRTIVNRYDECFVLIWIILGKCNTAALHTCYLYVLCVSEYY